MTSPSWETSISTALSGTQLELSEGLLTRELSLSLVTLSSQYLDNPDSGLQLLLPGDGESVELPVVERGLDGLAWLQHVAVPHGGRHSRSSPGLSLYLQSDKPREG